ncbi:50S ribosomal protein L21 [bacterium]|nr:50S ribosomal protein L21 [bacterium]
MYAIVDIGGMQWKVEETRTIKVPKLNTEPGKTVELKEVLLVVDKDQVNIGQPYVGNATIKATVISHGKDKKIVVFKKKRRKGYKVHKGHRQEFTELKIENIILGKAAPKATAAPKAATATKAAAAPKAKKTEAVKAPAKKAAPKTAAKGKADTKAPAKKTATKPKAAAKPKTAAKAKTAATSKTEATPKKAAKKATVKKSAGAAEKKED